MNLDKIGAYLDSLIDNSTLDVPAWNIEAARAGKKSGWNYVDGCMILAMIETWKTTGIQKYIDFAESYISHRVREDGSIAGYRVEEYNLDNVNAGKTLFLLHDITGKDKYRKAYELVYSQLLGQPRTEGGNFWHKLIYPWQIWLDGLYMSQPFYMEYATKKKAYDLYKDIYGQFRNVVALMRDEATGLYYHACDTSKTMFWCDPETGLSRHFWLRALGWYSMALLDTLAQADPEVCPEDYAWMKQVFRDLMDAMLRFRDEKGMWYQVVDLKDRKPNYPETSGSAIMSYCLQKGVRLGFLPEEYRTYGKEAFEGICERYLTEKDGSLNLGGICLVAGLGGPQKRDGSFDYYMSEPVVENDAKGVGPFLLAYTELRKAEKKSQ